MERTPGYRTITASICSEVKRRQARLNQPTMRCCELSADGLTRRPTHFISCRPPVDLLDVRVVPARCSELRPPWHRAKALRSNQEAEVTPSQDGPARGDKVGVQQAPHLWCAEDSPCCLVLSAELSICMYPQRPEGVRPPGESSRLDATAGRRARERGDTHKVHQG
ncbi:uncharacterized protein PSFLO_00361 [Pseudozyma flocculosa]|uniref:Uncharacterized protein n=1 Tax=Pseudozyma flocculosa TaxID=84751 RepID=A0A5C3ESR1_9BASI|nr:uncharacterized protein PSFLO_00361 [Pseudozyma flocculosa]